MRRAYLEQVRRGEKTSTIRMWSSCGIRPGDRLTLTDYASAVRVRCTGIEHRPYETLTPQEARADGFADLEAMDGALRAAYPALRADTLVWIVRFELLNDSDQSAFAIA